MQSARRELRHAEADLDAAERLNREVDAENLEV